jgi:hypothetical protein
MLARILAPALLAAALWITPAAAYDLCDRAAPAVTDVINDATVRQRIVDTAIEEWRRFGFQVLDFSTSEQEADLSPLLGFSVPLSEVPPALYGQPDGRLLRMGLGESDFQTSYAVRSYWSAVYPDDTAAPPLASAPWSAAFVSWVLCRSGLSETQFRRREAHVQYVGAAYADQSAYGDTPQNLSAYVVRPALGTPVRAGDLACFSHNYITFADVSAFADGAHRPTHCDIIVGFSHNGARILAIGGNVEQSVTMSVFAGRREGENTYLMTQPEWPAARPYFAIMQLRARPDLANAVTIRYARATP